MRKEKKREKGKTPLFLKSPNLTQEITPWKKKTLYPSQYHIIKIFYFSIYFSIKPHIWKKNTSETEFYKKI
jgi:hypothetical protein